MPNLYRLQPTPTPTGRTGLSPSAFDLWERLSRAKDKDNYAVVATDDFESGCAAALEANRAGLIRPLLIDDECVSAYVLRAA